MTAGNNISAIKSKASWTVAAAIVACVVILTGTAGCGPSGGGGGGGDGDAEGPESVVEDFYAAYAQGDMEKARSFFEVKAPHISEGVTSTVANIEQLGEYVGQYIIDFRFVGAPKAGNIDELMDILYETEINANRAISKDAWGNDFVYEANATMGSQDHTIMSYGSDGKDGPAPSVAGVVKRPEEDLIWANGTWVQKPAGHQRAVYVRLPYLPKDFEYSIDKVDSKDSRAEVTAIITADERRYEQKAVLQDDGGGWYIITVGGLNPLPDEPEEEREEQKPEEQPSPWSGPASDQEPRSVADRYLTAVRNFDVDTIEQMVTGEARELFIKQKQLYADDPELMARERERASKLKWEIEEVELEESGDQARVYLSAEIEGFTTPARQYLKMRKEGGQWKVFGYGRDISSPATEKAEEEPPQLEEDQ